MRDAKLSNACLAEVVGTFLLVFFGTGAVFVAVTTGELQGLLQVALVWGIAIGLAIYATAATSGAHLNPAVTLAVTVFRGFPVKRILPYVASQLLGAILAAALLYGLFSGLLADFEQRHGIERGQPGSQRSAMVFGEYFPNPGALGVEEKSFAMVTHTQAFAAEMVGTALLLFFIFALTDERNRHRPDGSLFAPFIGLTVAVIIAVVAPLTQAGLNPARDFGPRLFSYFVGWGEIAIPGPRGGFFTVYIIAPIAGGMVGAAIYQTLFRQREAATEAEEAIVEPAPQRDREPLEQ